MSGVLLLEMLSVIPKLAICNYSSYSCVQILSIFKSFVAFLLLFYFIFRGKICNLLAKQNIQCDSFKGFFFVFFNFLKLIIKSPDFAENVSEIAIFRQ